MTVETGSHKAQLTRVWERFRAASAVARGLAAREWGRARDDNGSAPAKLLLAFGRPVARFVAS
eukprot:6177853-Pleurochrysis_carterae.AAC.1